MVNISNQIIEGLDRNNMRVTIGGNSYGYTKTIEPFLKIGAEVNSATADSSGTITFVKIKPYRESTYPNQRYVAKTTSSKPNQDNMIISYVKDIIVAHIESGQITNPQQSFSEWIRLSKEALESFREGKETTE